MSVAAGSLLVPTPPGGHPFGVALTERHAIPQQQLLDPGVARYNAGCHPKATRYDVPAHLRAAAFALESPLHPLTSFGALALYGLPFFANSCDTVLISDTIGRTQQPAPLRPKVIRGPIPPQDYWSLDCRGQRIRAAAPAVAVAQALKEIRRGNCGWPLVAGGGVDLRFVWAVQLVDAAQRHLAIPTRDILAASHQRLDSRWVNRVLAASSELADSPPETELRLLATGLANQYGLVVKEQVPVMDGARYVTRFDLALVDPRRGVQIGLMYDGEHHGDYKQRQQDSLINVVSAAQGWTVFRFSSATLPLLHRLLGDYLREQLG